jgi:hypothetical protein
LEPGLSPRDVAISFARDWTTYDACLDWAPERNNYRGYKTGPITARCNRQVWGVPNAYAEWDRGRMFNREYYRPLSALWDKYTSYGVTILHADCPAGGKNLYVCEGFPYDLDNLFDGGRYDHHFPYDEVRLTYGGEVWMVFAVYELEDMDVYARFGWPIPVTAEFWEVPGCRLLPKAEYLRSCTIRMAAPYLVPPRN